MTKVPTTRTVMHRYVSSAIRKDGVMPMGAKEGFRVWLNEELAKAWDEGHEVSCEDVDYLCERFHPNPYRKVEE